jgi:hypothetical protein
MTRRELFVSCDRATVGLPQETSLRDPDVHEAMNERSCRPGVRVSSCSLSLGSSGDGDRDPWADRNVPPSGVAVARAAGLVRANRPHRMHTAAVHMSSLGDLCRSLAGPRAILHDFILPAHT